MWSGGDSLIKDTSLCGLIGIKLANRTDPFCKKCYKRLFVQEKDIKDCPLFMLFSSVLAWKNNQSTLCFIREERNGNNPFSY